MAFGGLEIDDQLELRRLRDGQVGGFSALGDFVDGASIGTATPCTVLEK